ncbi:MAG: DNA-binding protein WhiA [Bacilli bacterium]|nr:DNA-binding protein WhiA [Bacilli bacterium]
MSFSREVKKEISLIQSEECCAKAELYALIRFRSTISFSNLNYKITFTTTSNSTARRIVFFIKKIYNQKTVILQKERKQLDKKPLYYLILNQGRNILEDLGFLNSDFSLNEEIDRSRFQKDCCRASLLRGTFLARGSINDPAKNKYHLELVANNRQEAELLVAILEEINIDAKIVSRKKGEVVYLKKAENIADFLKYIGASNSLFIFEDFRIKKDLNNYVNRIINCDLANEQKALKSASKQIENIAYLKENYGLMNLSSRLLDAIILRTTFPDDSLSQLSEKSLITINRYLSKSGLSHCFRDIDNLVKELKKNKPK